MSRPTSAEERESLHSYRVTGHASNGMPEHVPYVYDRHGTQRRRQAEVDRHLAGVRARVTAKLGETTVCPDCGRPYFIQDGHTCG
jgi:hypothetical protein